jgi:hypothetical protein
MLVPVLIGGLFIVCAVCARLWFLLRLASARVSLIEDSSADSLSHYHEKIDRTHFELGKVKGLLSRQDLKSEELKRHYEMILEEKSIFFYSEVSRLESSYLSELERIKKNADAEIDRLIWKAKFLSGFELDELKGALLKRDNDIQNIRGFYEKSLSGQEISDLEMIPVEVLLERQEKVFSFYNRLCEQIDKFREGEKAQSDKTFSEDRAKTLIMSHPSWEDASVAVIEVQEEGSESFLERRETVHDLMPVESMNYAYIDELKNLIEVAAVNGLISYERFLSLRAFCEDHYITKRQFINAIQQVAHKIGTHFHVQTMPQDLSPKERGDKFEAFVTTLFKKKYFRLLEWRGDKRSPHGQLPESSMHPDLEYAFKLGQREARFAVECKWRERFSADDTIQWSYPEQVARYRAFSVEKQVPVFVVLGVGGMPQDPQRLYVVPLERLAGEVVDRAQLEPYEKAKRSQFYFDLKTQTLR